MTSTVIDFNRALAHLLDVVYPIVPIHQLPINRMVKAFIESDTSTHFFVLRATQFVEDYGGYDQLLLNIRNDTLEGFIGRNYSLSIELFGQVFNIMTLIADGIVSSGIKDEDPLVSQLKDNLELILIYAKIFQNGGFD